MTLPRITVITASINQARFLERAICSVLDQGYSNLDYIVIDAGSTDGSDEIVRHYRDRITYLRCASDATMPEAVNHALAYAEGDYVGLISAENLCLPGTLAEVAEAAREHPAWIVGSALQIDDRDRSIGELEASAPESLLGLLMHDSGFLPGVASFYRREILDAVGSFDTRLIGAFEYDMACRLLAAGFEPTIVDRRLGAEREHAHAYSVTHTLEMGLEYIQAAEHYADHLGINDRIALWRNCDQRRRIYALAQAEAQGSESQKFLWQQLLRRPWWLASDHYRQKLLAQAHHNMPLASPRHAA